MKTLHYNKRDHINNLVSEKYYKNLVLLRSIIAASCDEYFQALNAPRVDLFLITKEVSSPMGRGSDSVPIPIPFGKTKTFLTDSAQFGMEPLVQKNFKIVYCYLPSFRGEPPDDRHLNQFYHCEAELRGNYIDAMNISENLIKSIFRNTDEAFRNNIISFKTNNLNFLSAIIKNKFPVITFNEAHILLNKHGYNNLIKIKSFGRVLTNEGEKMIVKLVANNSLPVWVTKYDRDTVPFYQAPDPKNPESALNADLLFPCINSCFGGEIVGSGQRQRDAKEIHRSMKRQKVVGSTAYKWYLDLRNRKDYRTTSGFGLGIERLITWMLGLTSIADVCIYPVIKTNF